MSQPDKLSVSITDSWTIAKLQAYKRDLGLDYADTVRLAMRDKLPSLNGGSQA